jgi:DNA-binding transcriptional MerR regulator
MVVYSINDIEKISGVKAHTLRIWEKRYGIIQPKRTDTNIRYFLDDDLKHVLNIALLNKNGIKISKIAKMPLDEIKRKAAEISSVDVEHENQLDSLTLSLLELNEFKFDRIISSHIEQRGFETTMIEIVYPLMDKLGLMWVTGSINGAHERFVRAYIRQKIIAAIDKTEVNSNEQPTFLVFLPENEDHELSILFSQFLIKRRGFKIINLGLNSSLTHVKDACEITKPDYIYTILNDGEVGVSIEEYFKLLIEVTGDAKILTSGIQVARHNIKSNDNITVLMSFAELTDYLEKL